MESVKRFEREDRYIVIKRSDLRTCPVHRQVDFLLALEHLSDDLPTRECVVVESDWPEYEIVWAMIEHRMGGKPVPDFDRVTAEREALQRRLTKAEEELDLLQAQAVNDAEANTAIRAERDALQLLLNNRDNRDDQLSSLEQRRYAEQQAREAAERRVGDLELSLMWVRSQLGDPVIVRFIDIALNPTAEAESHVDCGSCRNITDGCKGTCQRSEEWSKP